MEIAENGPTLFQGRFFITKIYEKLLEINNCKGRLAIQTYAREDNIKVNVKRV